MPCLQFYFDRQTAINHRLRTDLRGRTSVNGTGETDSKLVRRHLGALGQPGLMNDKTLIAGSPVY
jgi:hypothetical protein